LKKLNVLAIDDHPVVLDGYQFMFQNLDHGFDELNFVKAYDCASAFTTINSTREEAFNIALIDYSIPPFPEENLYSGKDLALLVRKTAPNCKIVMMTMHREADIIFGIINSVNPEGFINKSDCNTDELMYGFKEVLNGNTFYSEIISNYSSLKQKGMVLEDIDVRIILFLARGVTDMSLGNYIPLTYTEIEKRKENIKRILGVTGNDTDLVDKARLQGYI
jgi:DNA-binding NarL/FixJ family response regulator